MAVLREVFASYSVRAVGDDALRARLSAAGPAAVARERRAERGTTASCRPSCRRIEPFGARATNRSGKQAVAPQRVGLNVLSEIRERYGCAAGLSESAVKLSVEKYCSVRATLGDVAVTWEAQSA